MTRIKNKKFALNMEKFSNNHTLKQSRNQRPEVTDSYCTTWILKDWVSMAQVGPLRDCQAIVVVQTAFLVSLSSFQLGVFHHCFMKSFVADRDLVPALYHSVWEKLSSDLQPGCLWPQVEGICCIAVQSVRARDGILMSCRLLSVDSPLFLYFQSFCYFHWYRAPLAV